MVHAALSARVCRVLLPLLLATAGPAHALEVGSLGLALINAAWTSGRSMASPRQDQTATLLQDGTVLVAGGTSGTATLASAELYDPASGSWSSTGSMAGARQGHSATLLTSGKVLVVGGADGTGSLLTAELYDPATRSWSATGSLSRRARTHHATVRLSSGKVLVAGGSGPGHADDDAELYDPVAGTWSAAGTMVQKRSDQSLVSLPGGKVLAVGGLNLQTGVSTASAELYDPAAGTWTATGSLAEARDSASAVLLPTGKVLVAGGLRASSSAGGTSVAFVSSAELYDPVSGTWAPTAALAQATSRRTAGAMLPSGRFLVTGGGYSQLFDPVAGTWSAAQATPVIRFQQTATALPSGKVLVAGGLGYVAPSWVTLASSEEYDPAVPAWSAGGAFAGLGALTLTQLPSGRRSPVFAVGGWSGAPAATTFLCDGAGAGWLPRAPLTTARAGHTATLLPSGKLLVVGGTTDNVGALAGAELYDLPSDTWTTLAAMSAARALHAATLLPSGKVLVAGGQDAGGALASAELFDPSARSWSPAGALTSPRYGHSAVLLPGGKVLVAGGLTTGRAPIAGAELFDPATGRWTATGSLATARVFHSATLLPSGLVLAVGGSGANAAPLASAELYDPATGTWSPAGALATARASHSATLLGSGKVLVAGGAGPASLASVEWFDPATSRWSPAGAMTTARQGHAAALLATGQVLVVGGAGPAAAELLDEVLGRQVAWTPDMAGVLPDLGAGQVLSLGGTLFTGLAEGSTGSFQASPGNHPLVQLRRAGSDQLAWARVTDFTATAVTAVLPAGLWPGYHWVKVVAGGVSSDELPLRIKIPAVVTPASPTAPPRGSVALGVTGGGTGYTWLISVDGSGGARVDAASGLYTAGPLGGTTDTVVVSDWMGPAGQIAVKVTAGLAIFGAELVPPRGQATFLARGGSGTGLAWSIPTNRSGGSIDAATGAYVAGPTGGVTDGCRVADSLGNELLFDVLVTAGVSIAPASATLGAGATQTFTATGGSGTGFTWSLAAGGSGGQIDPLSGVYRSGPAAGTTDTVQVTDSLGNGASATVTVQPAAIVAAGGCGCGQGGADLTLLPLGLLALARLRRRPSASAAGRREREAHGRAPRAGSATAMRRATSAMRASS